MPGDFERIAEYLGETKEQAKVHFWASGGSLVQDSVTGRQFRIGTITPRMKNGRCVFLDDNDRCRIHAVAPFGCAYFDTHMSLTEGSMRGSWLATETMSPSYRQLRGELPFATSYKPSGY